MGRGTLVVCFVALVGCGDGQGPSSFAGGQPADTRVTADATVGGPAKATEDGSSADLDASVQPADSASAFDPHAAYGTGPAGAAPIPCDVDAAPGSECTVAPTACIDGTVVVYTGGWCVDGTCRWRAQNTDPCADRAPGGRCAPSGSATGADAASFADDAGTWAVLGGCAFPVAAVTPPQVSCSSGDGGPGACSPPPSVCASSSFLLYYDQGVCDADAGQCAWQEHYTSCAAGCRGGACFLVNITAM
jgi:hypothetical protein